MEFGRNAKAENEHIRNELIEKYRNNTEANFSQTLTHYGQASKN